VTSGSTRPLSSGEKLTTDLGAGGKEKGVVRAGGDRGSAPDARKKKSGISQGGREKILVYRLMGGGEKKKKPPRKFLGLRKKRRGRFTSRKRNRGLDELNRTQKGEKEVGLRLHRKEKKKGKNALAFHEKRGGGRLIRGGKKERKPSGRDPPYLSILGHIQMKSLSA